MTLPSKFQTPPAPNTPGRMKHCIACSSTGLHFTASFCSGTSEDGQVDMVKLQIYKIHTTLSIASVFMQDHTSCGLRAHGLLHSSVDKLQFDYTPAS